MSPSKLRVLLDGWDLVYRPVSPAAFHLLEILKALQGEIELFLAIPARRPAWLSEGAEVVELLRACSPLGHLRWVQADLPRLARRVRANLIHTVQAAAPLFASQTVVYSPTQIEHPRERSRTFLERLDEALGWGGLVKAIRVDQDGIFAQAEAQMRDEPTVEGALADAGVVGVAESSSSVDTPFFLYQSAGSWEELRFLLRVWSKAASHLGDQAALAIVCLNQAELEKIQAHSTPEFLATLRLFVNVTPPIFLSLLESAIALIQLQAEPPWGGTAVRAISLGIPVVGFELPSLGEAVGPAGYLVPEGDERALLAAMLTVVVEEEVLTSLRLKARREACRRDMGIFRTGLLRLYRQALARKF
ncbi:MAG: hypothetical protein RML93_02720 [Anaerolineales bacterium]|nr:hypothetical protein [Anaerolineales bacterium]MDW8446187.1 hypothetical protein [Anaerolineales bacterium]